MTTKKSSLISSFEDVYTNGAGSGAVTGEGPGKKSVTVALLTTDIDAADIIHLIPIKSSAVVRSIKIFNDDLDTDATPTLAVHVGLYTAAAVAVDVDCFAAASTVLQAANTAGVEARFITANITGVNKQLWEFSALSADPQVMYYLSLTISNVGATAAAGDITVIVDVA